MPERGRIYPKTLNVLRSPPKLFTSSRTPTGRNIAEEVPWSGGTSKVPSNPGLMGPYEITLLYVINCKNTDIQQDNVNNIYAPDQTRKITYLGTHHPGLLSKSGFTHAGKCVLSRKKACQGHGLHMRGGLPRRSPELCTPSFSVVYVQVCKSWCRELG